MMGHREKMVGGAEYDCLRHHAKRYYKWKPGERKDIKRKFSRRVRRTGKRLSVENIGSVSV